MDSVTKFRRLMIAWFLFAALSAGVMLGLVIGILIAPKEKETIICPPFMDKAQQEIQRIDVWYELEHGPEYTELDYEFAKACGFETIKSPLEIQPPAPEEGGA